MSVDNEITSAAKFKANTEKLVGYIISHIRKLVKEGKSSISEVVIIGLQVAVGSYDAQKMIEHFIGLTWQPAKYVKSDVCKEIADGVLWDQIFKCDENFMRVWAPVIFENLLISKEEQFSNFTSNIPGMKFDRLKIQADVKDIFCNHMDTQEIKDNVWIYIKYMLISSIKYIWYSRGPVMNQVDGKLVQGFTKLKQFEDVKIMKYIKEQNIKVQFSVQSPAT